MLTFELEDEEQLFIHADADGLRRLISELDLVLAEHRDAAGSTLAHTHLMTADWGGAELTDQPQGTGRVIHHVKVYCWPSERP